MDSCSARPSSVPRWPAIYSRSHALLSAGVGAVAALAAGAAPARGLALVAYAVVVGVGIDLDHFLVARVTAGDWRALRRCLARPSVVLVDQSAIFEAGDVGKLRRLLAHALLGGGVVAGLALVDGSLAVLTAAVLYVHVVADLVADVRELDGPVA